MAIYLRGLMLGLDEPEDLLLQRAAARLRVPVGDIRNWAVVRRSLDARDKERIGFVYNIEMTLACSQRREERIVRRLDRADISLLTPSEDPVLESGREPLAGRPVVVGFGPAGMFSGLLLARQGYRPLIIERGRDVSSRHRDIMVDFYRDRIFNSESNLLFGEGGAGAYSDGKLHTRVNDPRVQIVLQTLFQHGAYPGVLIDGKPHIGSDKFPGICRRIRLTIEMLGGEVHFGARLDGVEVHDGRLAALAINGKKLSCGPVIMAVGHSARDTMRMLAREGVRFDLKPFQLGVRMEHPQSMVDRWQYGSACGHSRLPSAEYHLVAKGAAGLRGDVFSFCMCPGGMIVPTNELPGQISTNGASRSGRKGGLANSGLVLTLDPNDVCPAAANDPMAVLAYLEHIERAAFDLTGGSYRIPVQRASDFVARRMSDGRLETSYPLGGQWSDLRRLLPEDIAGAIARGIEQLDRRLSGFGGPESLVTAPETRPSSPLRMTRHSDTRESVSLAGLYPVGEGAGYAGGIVSAAIDGMKSAEVIVRRYAR